MLEFSHPQAFVLAPLPLLVWWLLPPYRRRVSGLRIPFFEEVVQASGLHTGDGSQVVRSRATHIVPSMLVWQLLVASLANPVWIGEAVERIEATRDVMLAVDLSASMEYRDFPDEAGKADRRLDVVKRVLGEFASQRTTDSVGLIVFGTKAYIQLPFTRDIASALAMIDLMDVGMAGPATALGDAIGLAIRAFEATQSPDRILILLTDGNDTASRMTPINAGEIAKLNDIDIYTIGVGDPEAQGEDRVDFATLEEIAVRTGGLFFRAQDETALSAIYTRIDKATQTQAAVTSWRPSESLLHWPAGLAFMVAVLMAGLGRVRGERETAG